MKPLLAIALLLTAIYSQAQRPKLVLPQGHNKAPQIMLNKDESLLLSVSDATVLVWNVKYERLLYNLSVPSKKLLAVQFNTTGDKVMIATVDSPCKIYDMRTGEVAAILRYGKTVFRFASYTEDGSKIISAHSDSSIVVWNAADNKVISTIKWEGQPTRVMFDSSMKHVIVTAEATRLDSIDLAEVPYLTEDLLQLSTNKRRSAVGAICFISSRNAILYYAQGAMELRRIDDNSLLASFPLRYISRYCLSDNKQLLAISDEVSIIVYNLVTGEIKEHELVNGGNMTSVSYVLHGFTDSNTVLVTSYYEELQRVKWRDKKTVFDGFAKHAFDPRDEWDKLPYDYYEGASGKYLAFSFPSGVIKLYAKGNDHASKIFKGKSIMIGGMQHNSVYNWLFTLVNRKYFNAWDLEGGRMVYSFTDSTFWATIYGFRFCLDGSVLFVDSDEGMSGHFRVSDGKPLRISEQEPNCWTPTPAIAINRTYIKGAYAGIAGEWAIHNYDTGEKRLVLDDSTNHIKKAVLSKDGSTALVVWENVGFNSGVNTEPYVDVWNVKQAKRWRMEIADRLVKDVVFSNNSKSFLLITAELNTFLVNVKTKAQLNLGQFEQGTFINDSIVALAHEGSITLYNYIVGKEVAKLISADDGDYLVVLPGIYYSGNVKDLSKVHYVKNGQIISFEQMDVQYNRPDLVLKALGSNNTALISAYYQAYLKRLKKLDIDPALFESNYSVPEGDFTDRELISYEQKNNKLTLRFRASDSTSTLKRFNVWINQVPVYGAKGLAVTASVHFDTSFLVTLSSGDNRIEAAVTNATGVESYRVPLFVKYIPAQPVKEKLHFIGIGINHYAESENDLSWSVKDIRDLALKLKSKYHDISIDTLFDEQVTKQNILELKKKLTTLEVDDKLIVSYSGHGVLSKQLDYYLSTHDITFSEPDKKGFSYNALESLVDDIKPRKKLVLIDACHSGEVDKDEVARMETAKKKLDSIGTKTKSSIKITPKVRLGLSSSFELMQNLFVNVSRGTGATIVSAAGGMQYAQERGDLQNGVFTYSIIAAFNQNTSLTVSQLKKLVGEAVERLTAGLQKPTSRNQTNAYDWVIW